MSFAKLQDAAGTDYLVANVIQNAAGANVTVDNNMQDAAAADHAIFTDAAIELGIRTVRFIATATRKFYAS